MPKKQTPVGPAFDYAAFAPKYLASEATLEMDAVFAAKRKEAGLPPLTSFEAPVEVRPHNALRSDEVMERYRRRMDYLLSSIASELVEKHGLPMPNLGLDRGGCRRDLEGEYELSIFIGDQPNGKPVWDMLIFRFFDFDSEFPALSQHFSAEDDEPPVVAAQKFFLFSLTYRTNTQKMPYLNDYFESDFFGCEPLEGTPNDYFYPKADLDAAWKRLRTEGKRQIIAHAVSRFQGASRESPAEPSHELLAEPTPEFEAVNAG